MKRLLKRLALIGIIASGIGGIVSGAYPVIGAWLGVIGLFGTVYDHFSNDRRSQFIEQFLETQNLLLARSGLGSSYTEIVKSEFKKKGYCKDAIKYLEKALDHNPDDLEALKHYVSIMSLNFSMRKWVKNIKYGPKNKEWLYVYKLAERGSKKYPDNFVLPASLGILLDLAGDHKLARKMFVRSGQLRHDPFWHVHLSVSYAMSGHIDLAVNELKVARKEGAQGWVIEYHCADYERELGNYDQAIEKIRKAYEFGGTIPQLRSIEEKCLFATGRLVASGCSKVKLSWQLLLLNPKRSFWLFLGACVHFLIMTIVLLSKKVWPLTSHIPLIRTLQYKYLSPIEPEFTVGCELVRKMHFRQALKLFEKCKKINPRDVRVFINLSVCCARIGDRERAISFTKEGLELEPDNNVLKHNLEQYSSGVKLQGVVIVDQ